MKFPNFAVNCSRLPLSSRRIREKRKKTKKNEEQRKKKRKNEEKRKEGSKFPVLPFLGFFWCYQGKTSNLPRIFRSDRTHKILGKYRENSNFKQGIPCLKLTKEIKERKGQNFSDPIYPKHLLGHVPQKENCPSEG